VENKAEMTRPDQKCRAIAGGQLQFNNLYWTVCFTSIP
jgi:hypothetical protein